MTLRSISFYIGMCSVHMISKDIMTESSYLYLQLQHVLDIYNGMHRTYSELYNDFFFICLCKRRLRGTTPLTKN